MLNVALVAAGGAIGSVLRYLVGVWSVRIAGGVFPWGTLIVNVVGSFLIGFLVEFIARRLNASMEMRLFLMTGVLGGFTTFSTYNLEFITLLCTGSFTYACTYALLNIVITFLCCFAGLIIGELLF